MTVSPAVPDADQVVAAVLEVVRPVVLTAFTPDSCVATTRVAIDVLERFGVRAEPLPVSVMILNAAAAEILAGGDLADVAAAVQAAPVHRAGGPWTIGLGAPVGARRAGHVVVMLRERREFLDLSLDQASRPRKRIVLAPSRFAVAEADLRFFTRAGARVAYFTDAADPDQRCLVMYEHDRSALYRASPNWRRRSGSDDPGVFARVTEQACDRVAARLG